MLNFQFQSQSLLSIFIFEFSCCLLFFKITFFLIVKNMYFKKNNHGHRRHAYRPKFLVHGYWIKLMIIFTNLLKMQKEPLEHGNEIISLEWKQCRILNVE